MTPCDDCDRARNDVRGYNRFNPACLTCGGRCLWFLQRLRIPAEQKVERLRKALADWMAYGHSEQQLRELAAQDWGAWAHDHNRR
jgi:hypothetical protein